MPRSGKILPLFLILLVLAGTSRFSMGMHYCMGQLRDVALFGNAGTCDMPRANSCNHQPQKDSGHYNAKGCCENISLAAATLDELTPAAGVSLSCSPFTPERHSIRPVYESSVTLNQRFPVCYSPPPPVRDIPVLNHSFLI